jgi:hypothetical protein
MPGLYLSEHCLVLSRQCIDSFLKTAQLGPQSLCLGLGRCAPAGCLDFPILLGFYLGLGAAVDLGKIVIGLDCF